MLYNLRSSNLYLYYRYLRTFFYRLFHSSYNIDYRAFISRDTQISNDVRLSKWVYIGPGCSICPKVSVGDYSMFGPQVTITGSDHIFDSVSIPIQFAGRPQLSSTNIGKDVWIGKGSIIMAGVSIGDGTIVGAGSIVTKDLDSNSVYVGNPAKFVRFRFSSSDWNSHLKSINSGNCKINFCGRLEKY